MTTQDWLYRTFVSRSRWLSVLVALLLCSALALGAGYLLAECGPLIAGAGVIGLFLGIWMLRDIEIAIYSVIGIVCLVPFASFPFDIGFRPTLLDAALGALFLNWLIQLAGRGEREFIATPLGLPVVVFMLLAVGSFIFGLAHVPLALGFLQYYIRHFGEVLLSVGLFFLIVSTVRDEQRLGRIARALILGAFGAALLGTALYVIADQISSDFVIRVLSALGRIGYPTGPDVVRYIRDDPELPMRATSTSVDPNVLGSLLNVALAVSLPQLFAERWLFRRRYLVPILGILAVCLGLTMSRGSMVGLGAAVVVLATLRYRRLWIVLGGGLAVLLLLPQTRALVMHFLEGFRGEDLATQMRFGEYRDALILIRRYPLLGVGFAGSPDIDTYIGVANVYLLIAQHMGLIGLSSFLTVMTVLLARFWRTRHLARGTRLEPLWWGLHGGIIGALVGGIFDHYFFNLDFHHSVTLFWLVVGLATAATELIRSQGRNDGSPSWL